MKKKHPTVMITGPASRLPRGLGDVRPTVAKPEPVTPKTIAKHRQITASPRVEITDGRKGVRND
jgi:hypothetical protein